MLPPSKKYRACLDELKLWTPVAYEALLTLVPADEPMMMLDQPAFDTAEDGELKEGFSGLSAGYALRRYFLAFGQLTNLIEVLSARYPDKRDQFESDLTRYAIDGAVRRLGEVAEVLLSALAVRSRPGLSARAEVPLSVDELADMICEVRRYLDFLRGSENVSVQPYGVEFFSGSQWRISLERQLASLSFPQRKELAARMRSYMSSNYVLHSMPVSNERARDFHETLLSATEIPGEEMYNIDIDGFLAQVSGSDVNEGDVGEVRRILENLASILSDVPFGDLSDVIGDWGGMSPFENINIIPSNGTKGTCRRSLLAIANGSGASKKGFLGVMRQVRQHLIDCFGRTRIVVLLTDTWDPAKFRESRADIEAHRRQGVIFVTGVVSGRNISPTPLPF